MFKEVAPVVRALRDVETYTTVLLAILLEHYGSESMGWTPETIFMELYEDFGVDLPKQNKDQIVVGLNLVTSDDFYKRLPFFIQSCNVLSGSELVPYFDKADAGECAWGVTEAAMIWPSDKEDQHPFSEEIVAYIQYILRDEGVAKPPAILQAALRSSIDAGDDLPIDDPETLAAAKDIRAERTKVIEEMLRENLSTLLHQLAALPGCKDRVEKVVADMRRANR